MSIMEANLVGTSRPLFTAKLYYPRMIRENIADGELIMMAPFKIIKANTYRIQTLKEINTRITLNQLMSKCKLLISIKMVKFKFAAVNILWLLIDGMQRISVQILKLSFHFTHAIKKEVFGRLWDDFGSQFNSGVVQFYQTFIRFRTSQRNVVFQIGREIFFNKKEKDIFLQLFVLFNKILLSKRNLVKLDIIFSLLDHKIIKCQNQFIVMFSKNNVYAYEEREEEIFERQLPYRSLKIPYRQSNQKMLKSNQKRHQVQRLRQQILKKCKFDELQYLQIMKQQRQEMAYKIRQNKRLMEIKKMEQLCDSDNKMRTKKQEQNFQDSLDQFRKEKTNNSSKAKSNRGDEMQLTFLNDQQQIKKYKKMNLIQKELIKASNNKQQKEKFERQQEVIKQLNKVEGIKKIKRQMLSKYKFYGQTGKRELKPNQIQNKTQVQWWVNKVRQYKKKQALQNKNRKQQTQKDTNQHHENNRSNINSQRQQSDDQHLDH